mgnify:CR=1 FL=1
MDDKKKDFLQGDVEEEVFMIQPPGFESTKHLTAICQLKKPLYGLKQAPHAWHSKITQYLHQIGFCKVEIRYLPLHQKWIIWSLEERI